MNFDKVLRNLIIGLVFFVPFIPFIVSNSMFFPFITGKNFTFRIVTEIMLGLWVILALRNAYYRPQFSWILVGVTSFVVIIGIADMFGVNPSKSFWSNFERMEGYITILHLFAYFLVVGATFKTKEIWNWFLHTTVGASVIMGLYGMVQLGGAAVINQGGDRVDGKFGNATYLAVYMLFHMFITAILLARWRGGYTMRLVYVAAIVLQGILLFYTATRGSILGLLGGVLLAGILLLIIERKQKIVRNIGLGMFAGIIILVGGFFAIKDADFVQENLTLKRFANISADSGTVRARFTIWSMAWEGVKERPLLGWGQENFNLVFNEQYNPVLHSDEPWFDRVHNVVFDWLIAGGILGLLAYVSMPLLLLYYLWFRKNDVFSSVDKSLITGMIAGYVFHNLFVFDNIFSYIMFFTILAYVYAMTAHEPKEDSKFMQPIDTGTVDRVALPLIVIATIFVIFFANTKGIMASRTLIEALRPQAEPAGNILSFREALAHESPIATQEIREQIVQGAARARNAQNLDLEIRQELFNFAVSEMTTHIEENPGDARHELFLASLLDSYGQFGMAEEHFKKALELSPQKQSLRFAYAGNLINQGRLEEAEALLKETAELVPEYQEGQIMYAVSAIYGGKPDLVDEILTKVSTSSIANSNRLLQAYANTSQIEESRDLLILRAELKPNDVQARMSLAAAYLQLNQREEAIGAIEEIIVIDPNFKDQGEYLINEIRAGRNP